MIKHLMSILFIVCMTSVKAQTHTTLLSGNWTGITTWTPVLSDPDGSDSAVIGSIYTVSITSGTAACNGLNLNGTLNMSGGTFTTNSTLDLNTSGDFNISGGIATVIGNLDYDGTLNITNTSSYVEIQGDIKQGGATKIITNDGSIRIYSELDF